MKGKKLSGRIISLHDFMDEETDKALQSAMLQAWKQISGKKITHITSGYALRKANSKKKFKDSIYQTMTKEEGRFSDPNIQGMIFDYIGGFNKGFILDQYPRSEEGAKTLLSTLQTVDILGGHITDRSIDFVTYTTMPVEEVIKKIEGRGYGQSQIQRTDDEPQNIRGKWNKCYDMMNGVKDYFASRGIPIIGLHHDMSNSEMVKTIVAEHSIRAPR